MTKLLGVASIFAGGALVFMPANDVSAATIYACKANTLGTIRIVSASTACTSYETKISWNTVGPQGPAGPQGLPGVTAGISAAINAEVTINGDQNEPTCTVGYFRGADSATGSPTGNSNECIIDFTLPAGQPQSWGTAYMCFTQIPGGYGVPWGTTCHTQSSYNQQSLVPEVSLQCLDGSGQPISQFLRINLLCVH